MDSISKNSKSRNKKQLSFREFEGSTNDVWDDDDDDIIKLGSSPSHEPSATNQPQGNLSQVRVMSIALGYCSVCCLSWILESAPS